MKIPVPRTGWHWSGIGVTLAALVAAGTLYDRGERFIPATRGFVRAAQAEDAKARDQITTILLRQDVRAIDGQISDRLADLLDVRAKVSDGGRDPVLQKYLRRLEDEIRDLENELASVTCMQWLASHPTATQCPMRPKSVLEP